MYRSDQNLQQISLYFNKCRTITDIAEMVYLQTGVTKLKNKTLKQPKEVSRKIHWTVMITLISIHVLAISAAFPWFFSWSGLGLMIFGLYFFGTLGINLCFHRLLTHRSFKCPVWLNRVLTCIGVCNMQGSSIRWVAAHRLHHQHSDHQPDPHSPLVNFLWSHMGWLCVFNRQSDSIEGLRTYAGDLCKDPFHLKMEKNANWVWVWIGHIAIISLAGFIFGAFFGEGLRIALSWLVWGVLVRHVVVWHITWAINSLTHLWGYRSFDTQDNSRNNWLLGYMGMGEGWHNNHHAHQSAAKNSCRWWEIDITYITIWIMSKIGLASHIVRRP